MKSNLNSLELQKCYFLYNHKQICSKVPIVVFFLRPKCSSGNCYVSCFLTEKTPLIQILQEVIFRNIFWKKLTIIDNFICLISEDRNHRSHKLYIDFQINSICKAGIKFKKKSNWKVNTTTASKAILWGPKSEKLKIQQNMNTKISKIDTLLIQQFKVPFLSTQE